MKHLINSALACVVFGTMSQTAHAGDTSECELLLVQIIASEDGAGEAQVPSFIPAEDFVASLDDKKTGHMTQYLGHKIQAIMCSRNEVIPAKSDYDIMATGIPFILSQDFDSPDTDSLTMYWKDGKIEHVYKGYPLSDEAETTLETRLAEFSKRGLNDWAIEAAEVAAKDKAEAKAKAKLTEKLSSETESEVIDASNSLEITTAETEVEVEVMVEGEETSETENLSPTDLEIDEEAETVADAVEVEVEDAEIQTEEEIEE